MVGTALLYEVRSRGEVGLVRLDQVLGLPLGAVALPHRLVPLNVALTKATPLCRSARPAARPSGEGR